MRVLSRFWESYKEDGKTSLGNTLLPYLSGSQLVLTSNFENIIGNICFGNWLRWLVGGLLKLVGIEV
jgi:hypothetical protein